MTRLGRAQEQLIIFVQDGGQSSEHFKAEYLDSILQYANQNDIDLLLKEVTSDSLPEGITLTPSIVYQNSLGRSLYQGRYSTIDRLINFIRTVKNEPKKEEQNEKHNILIWNNENAIIAMPLKITPLTGSIGNNFDQLKFIETSKRQVGSDLSYSKHYEEIILPRHARSFYVDLYPWLSDDSLLYISGAVFSMFNCIDPVFRAEQLIVGSWRERSKLFAMAGKKIERVVAQQLNNLSQGDAFIPISKSINSYSWDKVGLSLPQKVSTPIPDAIYLNEIPKHWHSPRALDKNSPVIQFHFGAPIDYYAGEAQEMKVQLNLAKRNSLLDATGHVVVDASSITMGDEGLDDHIFHSYLKIFSYPNATYDFKIVRAPSVWHIDSIQPIALNGVFEMIGKKVEISATGTAQMVANENERFSLSIHGNFMLPLHSLYGIEGPDGPSPAKDELHFQLNFLLSPGLHKVSKQDNLYEALREQPVVSSDGKEIVLEEFVSWKARNRIYKAEGGFDHWRFMRLSIKNDKIENLTANIEIDINSISEKSKLLVKHLKGEDFFQSDYYPKAFLDIRNVKKLQDESYVADGFITIKDIKEAILVNFDVIDKSTLTIRGSLPIDREAHNIGTSKKSQNISKIVDVTFQVILKDHIQKQ